MTVWIVNPFDNLPAEGYRPQRYWLMAEAFAAAGHDVTLWTQDWSHARKTRRKERPSGKAFALRFVHVPGYRRNICFRRMPGTGRWRRGLRRGRSLWWFPALRFSSAAKCGGSALMSGRNMWWTSWTPGRRRSNVSCPDGRFSGCGWSQRATTVAPPG